MSGLIKWKKGQSGNPNGRRKGTIEYDPDFRLFRPHTQAAVDMFVEMLTGQVTTVTEKKDAKGKPIIKDGKPVLIKVVEPISHALQFAAGQIILERGWGKAPQAIHVKGADPESETALSEEKSALEFIASRLNGIAARVGAGQAPEVIDVEPTREP